MTLYKLSKFWRGAFFLWVCISIISVFWAPTAAAWFDNKFLVVVTQFDVTRVEVHPGGVRLSGRMYKPKYRESCLLQEVVVTINEEEQFQLFEAKKNGVFTRSSGWSSFAGWLIPGANIRNIKIVSRHSCHKFWDNVATLWDSPIPLPVEVTVSTQPLNLPSPP